jgi:hypothetical protein
MARLTEIHRHQKSCEGWMGPNPMRTHCRVCVLPCFAIRGRTAL